MTASARIPQIGTKDLVCAPPAPIKEEIIRRFGAGESYVGSVDDQPCTVREGLGAHLEVCFGAMNEGDHETS